VIDNYCQTFVPVFNQQGDLFIAIRIFSRHGIYYYLTVNAQTLDTSIQPLEQMLHRSLGNSPSDQPNYFNWSTLAKTPYIAALMTLTAPPWRQQNHGLTHALHEVAGMVLTVDMCPSIKLVEKAFFQELVQIANDKQC